MGSFNITTKDGDRIDQLAHRFYGSQAGISIIADANPSVPLYPVYPIGTSLIIPIIEDDQVVTNELLPPWRR